ncbi:methylated-DNA--[protein]-cysteine S-methyltransferase [Metasolibacillus sp.]|uniref:methylated-DNA--[protein]-cysteine S-methyltransferase n=1 Tax=Metasolibacillus sp. TaxID=2703680 RepID=UPI0025D7EEAF|nr:methylated-DNA--[protein]-cysteine S-methyltransferase [Metasolibacillus sp.]MCT6924194.1 methylated-DNA--[protein]-cysteine S-methyltransferase [Metasolibacillus sp.]MCT6940404.1 methylated-DNA--[protein]-cysteine S-methyltransferase [Metasolibacillus sp.]
MEKKYKLYYKSPLGTLEIVGTAQAIFSIVFVEKENIVEDEVPPVLSECYNQLDEYFKGERQEFTVPYYFEGTDFQKRVWGALTDVPYAQTVSYKDIAVATGYDKAVRAVGSANGKNKLSIIVPCHRIIGSNGTLTGYAGGLWRKEWLLQHEQTMKKDKS